MRFVRIGQCPNAAFGAIKFPKESFDARFRPQDALQRQCRIALGIVVERIDLVVHHEAADRKAVLFVVAPMQSFCLLAAQTQAEKVRPDPLRHQLGDPRRLAIQRIVNVEPDDCASVIGRLEGSLL